MMGEGGRSVCVWGGLAMEVGLRRISKAGGFILAARVFPGCQVDGQQRGN